MSNVPASVERKRSVKLHLKEGSPIRLIKERIYRYFQGFKTFDELSEVVSVEDNFDLLLIPKDHPSRSRSDTYYLTPDTVLRTHTSAHQNELLARGETQFLVTGDVYRRDEIDRFHYPVFHQMEGVKLVDGDAEQDLKTTLTSLVGYLFPEKGYRLKPDYFPFTEPSYEVEVLLGDRWVEILGCGVIHRKILDRHSIQKSGWAFGLGLERLAIIFYSIPDIRLFWTDDVRFTSQFKSCDEPVTFVQYPKLASNTKDISFWLPVDQVVGEKWLNENEFFDTVRSCLDTNVEKVELIDQFYSSKRQQHSRCWRLTLSPSTDMSDPGEFNRVCNEQMERLRAELSDVMKLEVR